MAGKPTYEELKQRVKELEKAEAERKQAEESLREERDRAQMYLDIAGVMFVALDSMGKLTLINKKGCEILGYNEKEIVGKNGLTIFCQWS